VSSDFHAGLQLIPLAKKSATVIPIVVTQLPDLLSLRSGTVTFDRANGALIQIGPIFARFEVDPFTDALFTLTRVPVPETLTMLYKFTGAMPFAPFGRFSIQPENLGTVEGKQVFLWWHLSRMHKESDLVQLQYEVYVKNPLHN
jgi:hypothetical protein